MVLFGRGCQLWYCLGGAARYGIVWAGLPDMVLFERGCQIWYCLSGAASYGIVWAGLPAMVYRFVVVCILLYVTHIVHTYVRTLITNVLSLLCAF